MASSEVAVDAGAPTLNLTPEEKRVYGQLFRQADTDNVGVVTGEVAVKFFEKTRLDSRTLGEIWQIADKENRGFLTPAGFGIVLRLIGHAQAGREPTAEIALQPGPVPRFDGIAPPAPTGSPSPAAGGLLQAQVTGGGGVPVRIPPLTPDKVVQYSALFERQTLLPGGLLPGDQAKQIFEKAGLPNEILGRVWQLADTEQRGAFVLTEFVIAMHLLTSLKTGALRGLPAVLPAGLYEAATRRGSASGPSPFTRQLTGQLTGQFTGQAQQAQMRTGSPLARSAVAPQLTGDWLISRADKARFDHFFDELDKSKKNLITGEEAVPFFSQSNLSEDTLAQIWDLADIRSEGMLNRDEFAVAMYLIRQQRSKKDGSSTLPSTLPPNLIPPSMRGQPRPAVAASPFDAPPQPAQPVQPPQVAPAPQPKSALDDLLGLDSSSAPSAPAQMAMGTGGSNDPFAGATSSPPAPSSPIRPTATGSQFKQFMPTSNFGRTLTAQATGDSTGSAPSFPQPTPATTGASTRALASASDDLLGDHDSESSKKISNDAMELGNLSNQIGSLSKQMQDAQGQRSAAQNEISQVSVQKKNFEQRLSQLRALYEKEVRDVRALEQQLTALRGDNKKIQTELAMLDGTYQDLQNQRQQVLAGLQADQQENASLKERIRAVNAEVAQIKPQIEKLKSEARQQKGLVAINKKQLATNEGERERLKTEAEDLTRSNAELARQAASESPQSAQVASPAPSTTSANNPFFRRTASTDIAATFSPPIKPFNDKSFDDVFGPSIPASSTPPPATSFRAQNTGTSVGSAGSSGPAAAIASSPSVSRQPTIVAEPPPAPPESRQLTPGFLPFGDASESLSSSRQVSPPASRLGHIDTLTGEPQGSTVASPLDTGSAVLGIGSALGAEAAREVTSPAPASPPPAAAPAAAETKPTSNGEVPTPGAGPSEGTPTVPGAFPQASAAAAETDPFASLDHKKAKDDFDSAFASFKDAHASSKNGDGANEDASQAFSTFNSEFPPISELEREDDTESDSDKGGFDDDFTPVSPPKKAGETELETKAASPKSTTAAPAEPFGIPEGSGAIGAASHQETNAKSVSSPFDVDDATNPTHAHVNDIFGSSAAPAAAAASVPAAVPQAAAPASLTSTATTTTKSAFDDLDDDFDGLEDAREGSADDDFATISRSGLDDFNPVFDSSPPPSQAAKSVESAATNATANHVFGTDSSFDFGTASTTSAAAIPTPQASVIGSGSGAAAAVAGEGKAEAGKPSPPDSHDWDAIFASLDDPPKVGDAAAAAAPASTSTTNANAKDKNGGGPRRPDPPGRALTEAGVHDDPILKSLTGMGYSRKDALSALEKYDYNLDRAANFLASQS